MFYIDLHLFPSKEKFEFGNVQIWCELVLNNNVVRSGQWTERKRLVCLVELDFSHRRGKEVKKKAFA